MALAFAVDTTGNPRQQVEDIRQTVPETDLIVRMTAQVGQHPLSTS